MTSQKYVSSSEAEEYFKKFMNAVMQPQADEDPHLLHTPARVTRMYSDFFNPPMPILTTFPATHNELVIIRDIDFYSLCAHHLLPFFGTATIGYIPDGSILGLSKFPRVVDFLAHRPHVQENLTSDIANFLMQDISDFSPQAVGVMLQARHLCMEMRGVEKPGTVTETSALRGTFLTDAAQRAEFMSRLK